MTTRDPRTQAFLAYINSYNATMIMGQHIQG